MQKRIITITGLPGSGKSSTANGVAKKLGYARYSSGQFMREIALKRGLTLDQSQQLAKTDPSIDEEVDREVQKMGAEEDLVIDSRTAFHWIPESFKVLLKLDLKIAAERIYKEITETGRLNQTATSIEEVYTKMLKRIESECKRYQEKYGIDYREEKNYDLVVDTAKNSLPQVIEIITEAYKAWQKS
jgi:cytidylate kinase